MNQKKAKNISVRGLLKTTVVVLRPDDDLLTAEKELGRGGFSVLPVADKDNKFLGTVETADLFDKNGLYLPTVIGVLDLLEITHSHDIEEVHESLKNLNKLRVSSIMNQDAYFLTQSTNAEEALETFLSKSKPALAVVNNLTDRQLVGVLPQETVLRYFAGHPVETGRGRVFTKQLEGLDVFQELREDFVMVSRARARAWLIGLFVFLILGAVISIALVLRVRIF